MPGHTGGWLPLAGSTAVQFCGSFPAHEERPQLYNDPANATLKVVLSLLTEMSTLFTDEYFNIGSDETFSFTNAVGPNCSGSNSAGLEQAVAEHVRSVWGRRVMGWDALITTGNQFGRGPGRKGGLSDTAKVYWHGAPSSETIVNGGIDWVAASKDHSYLDHGTQPSGFWWDIRQGTKKSANGTETTSLLSTGLLGGEVCHWTDKYCYIFECLTTWHDPFSESTSILPTLSPQPAFSPHIDIADPSLNLPQRAHTTSHHTCTPRQRTLFLRRLSRGRSGLELRLRLAATGTSRTRHGHHLPHSTSSSRMCWSHAVWTHVQPIALAPS